MQRHLEVSKNEMAKILVVEDDDDMTELIGDALALDNHEIETVGDGPEGLDRLRLYSYDLAIIDWGLPGLQGVEVCRRYRDGGGKISIMMLTARAAVDEKVDGLVSGADDYLVKPFDSRELRARVNALLRRPVNLVPKLSFQAVSMQPGSNKVKVGEEDIELSRRELMLLEFFLRHPQQIFSAQNLLDRLWSSESDATEIALRACVKRLRKKIEVPGSGCAIESIYGLGYKLEKTT